MVNENPPIFRYFIKKESAYYPNPISFENLKNIEKSSNKKVYFIFTRFNSGLETENYILLKRILSKNYKKEFECSLDPEVNFIYSNKK